MGAADGPADANGSKARAPGPERQREAGRPDLPAILGAWDTPKRELSMQVSAWGDC